MKGPGDCPQKSRLKAGHIKTKGGCPSVLCHIMIHKIEEEVAIPMTIHWSFPSMRENTWTTNLSSTQEHLSKPKETPKMMFHPPSSYMPKDSFWLLSLRRVMFNIDYWYLENPDRSRANSAYFKLLLHDFSDDVLVVSIQLIIDGVRNWIIHVHLTVNVSSVLILLHFWCLVAPIVHYLLFKHLLQLLLS